LGKEIVEFVVVVNQIARPLSGAFEDKFEAIAWDCVRDRFGQWSLVLIAIWAEPFSLLLQPVATFYVDTGMYK
jgi:hypothetical protein